MSTAKLAAEVPPRSLHRKLKQAGILPVLRDVADQARKKEAVLTHKTQVGRLFNPGSVTSIGNMPEKLPPELFFVDKKLQSMLQKNEQITGQGT